MVVWRQQRCFLLLGLVCGGSSTGNQPPVFRGLAPKIDRPRQHHHPPEHVVGGIRGGETPRAEDSTATAGLGVVEDSSCPGGNADLRSREAATEPSERVRAPLPKHVCLRFKNHVFLHVQCCNMCGCAVCGLFPTLRSNDLLVCHFMLSGHILSRTEAFSRNELRPTSTLAHFF